MRSAVHGWRWCGRVESGSEVWAGGGEEDAGQASGGADAAASTLASAMGTWEVKVIVGAAVVEHAAGERESLSLVTCHSLTYYC